MRTWITGGTGLAMALVAAPLGAQISEIDSVETPMGIARIEGTTVYPNVERLVIGDRTVVEPDPNSALQVVWIEAQVRDLLLVGLGSMGNGCWTEYVWVHTAPEDDLRTSEMFGTCGGGLEINSSGATVVVSMASLNPDEGRLEYTYDGREIRERVLGMQESHSGPEASARNWIGEAPARLFSAADWRASLVELMGEAAYETAQDIFDLSDDGGMQLSEKWVSGMGYGYRDSSGEWGAVAIHDDDRRILVVLGSKSQPVRMWGNPNGPLPQPILDAILFRP